MIDKCICILEHGLFQSLAHRLAREYDRVLLFRAWTTAFPTANELQAGKGYDEFERIETFWDKLNEIDTFCFADSYFSDWAKHLRELGKRVWSPFGGEELEMRRWQTKELLQELGLPVQPCELVTGMKELRAVLKKREDQYVKVDLVRGLGETWHHVNYELSKPKLDEVEHILGGMADIQEFIIEDSISTKVECYDKETEVLTKSGWKLLSEVLTSDLVATINPLTHAIEYQKPLRTIKRFSESIFTAKHQKIDLAITENHNLLVNTLRDKALKLKPLSQLPKGRFRVKADGIWQGKELEWFVLPSTVKGRGRSTIHSGERIIRMDDWLYFLGWFFSDGSITRDNYTTIITQSFVHETERSKIADVLNKLPFRWNTNGCSFRICSKQLYDYLKPFSYHSKKRLPSFIQELSSRQIRLFLDGLFDGDGTTATNLKTKLYCLGVDKSLADDVQILLLHAGANGAVLEKQPQQGASYIGSRKVERTQKTYIVSEHSSRYYCIEKSYFKKCDYNDYVYCVTVPNGTIYVRRGGKPMWCGNCGYDGWCIDGRFPQTGIVAVESKDAGCFAMVKPYRSLPQGVLTVNDALAPTLAGYGYRAFFSTEIRIGKQDRPYLIDVTARAASPCGECYQELFSNLGEVIEAGANGDMVEPIPVARYAAQAILASDFAEKNWMPIFIPENIRQFVKLYNSTRIDDMEYIIPTDVSMREVGSVVGIGNTPDEAVKKCEAMCGQVQGFALTAKTDVLKDAQKDLMKVV